VERVAVNAQAPGVGREHPPDRLLVSAARSGLAAGRRAHAVSRGRARARVHRLRLLVRRKTHWHRSRAPRATAGRRVSPRLGARFGRRRRVVKQTCLSAAIEELTRRRAV